MPALCHRFNKNTATLNRAGNVVGRGGKLRVGSSIPTPSLKVRHVKHAT
jgi:hypothetical protein